MPAVWRLAERLLPILRDPMRPRQREKVLASMFERGQSLFWLTTVFRSETFAHGRYGNRAVSEEDRLLSAAELDRVTEIMLTRYRTADPKTLLAGPRLLSVLFAWRQGGDEVGPKTWVDEQIETPEGLVDVLEGMASIRVGNRGSTSILSEENVGPFIDRDAARERLAKISTVQGPLKERAARLVRMLAAGEDR